VDVFAIKYGNNLLDLTRIAWPRRTVMVPCGCSRRLLI